MEAVAAASNAWMQNAQRRVSGTSFCERNTPSRSDFTGIALKVSRLQATGRLRHEGPGRDMDSGHLISEALLIPILVIYRGSGSEGVSVDIERKPLWINKQHGMEGERWIQL